MGGEVTRLTITSLLLACAALGCAAEVQDEDEGGHESPLASEAGFAATVEPLIGQACNCHQTEPILMAPFSLKRGEAYGNLVDKPSSELPSMMLVSPGALNQSYLWHKINDTQLEVGGSGTVMPSTVPLNDEEKRVFERWIAAGAPP